MESVVDINKIITTFVASIIAPITMAIKSVIVLLVIKLGAVIVLLVMMRRKRFVSWCEPLML